MTAFSTRRALLAGASFCAYALFPQIVAAQPDELPEVVVTATRVEEPLARTGGSISVVSP